MSGRGVGSMPKPLKKYRIRSGALDDGSLFAFETLDEAKEEDKRRCQRLSRLTCSDARHRKQIARLIRRINTASTIASLVEMHRHRKRIGGHLLRLVDKSGDVRFFTLLPSHWVYPSDILHEVDVRKLVAALRQALRRRGASQAIGWLFGFVDGEYEPTSGTFRLHIHGLVAGEMINVVDGLEDARTFRPIGLSRSQNAVRQPIRRRKITKTPIRVVTYCIKGFWCERPIFENKEGKKKRGRKKCSIRGLRPYAEHLLWLDRWQVRDLALVMGMSVTKSGFSVRRKCT